MLSVEHLDNYKRKASVCLPVALTDTFGHYRRKLLAVMDSKKKAGFLEGFLKPPLYSFYSPLECS